MLAPVNPVRVQTRFGTLAGTSGGLDDDRPPLVLLHGLTFDRTMWWPALAALERLEPGRRTLALDLPGHGQSPPQPSYDLPDVVELVQEAVVDAGLVAPIFVGHSIAGVLATMLAARHPASGAVAVDQLLETTAFVEQLHALEPQLRGVGFAEVWARFHASMRIDLLPPAARELAEATTKPTQELVVGYWEGVFQRSAAELRSLVAADLAELRAAATPYELIAGSEPGAAYRAWLTTALPQARVTVIPETGHFPQLGDPSGFAARLASR
jgi:pimeloyl-ACP methyl ester carboxylesterase